MPRVIGTLQTGPFLVRVFVREKLHSLRCADGHGCLLQILSGTAESQSTAVLQKLAQAVAAEGFSGIQINKALSSIDAHQETSGSGRIQTLRVVARQKGAAVRIDAVFNIQAGQIADKDVIRKGICAIIKGV